MCKKPVDSLGLNLDFTQFKLVEVNGACIVHYT